ncbi:MULTISPECIES: DUF2690 domain-containing protein [unclassified Nonomuraea]|uniref:DUF2690 domain-containing protein n=1 Tax=unclassified Nonomuraea TaxID=2593643 RepID=UPI0033E2F24A
MIALMVGLGRPRCCGPWLLPGGGKTRSCEGLDPIDIICSGNSSTVFARSIDYLGTHYGTLEIRWSPACGVNWTRIVGISNGACFWAQVRSSHDAHQWPVSGAAAYCGGDRMWTDVTYAPNEQVNGTYWLSTDGGHSYAYCESWYQNSTRGGC